MRLAELCRRSGIPHATVKWYLRIGLVPRGRPTAANQALYDESHLRRLLLVRALLDIGGLSVAAARQVVDAIDNPAHSLHDILGIAHAALSSTTSSDIGPQAMTDVDAFLRHRGWQVAPGSPARHDLAAVLATLHRLSGPPASETSRSEAGSLPETSPHPPSTLMPAEAAARPAGLPPLVRLLDPYADAVDALAAAEVAQAPLGATRDELVERAVTGTVLMERALVALRRLAQEHYSSTQPSPAPSTTMLPLQISAD